MSPSPSVQENIPGDEELEHFFHEVQNNPDLSGQEQPTVARILRVLKLLHEAGLIRITTNVERNALAVDLLPSGWDLTDPASWPPQLAQAVMGDMDALPSEEHETGAAHLCGHDVHTTAVLKALTELAPLREQLEGPLRFIFEPAEENQVEWDNGETRGGAEQITHEGALARRGLPYEVLRSIPEDGRLADEHVRDQGDPTENPDDLANRQFVGAVHKKHALGKHPEGATFGRVAGINASAAGPLIDIALPIESEGGTAEHHAHGLAAEIMLHAEQHLLASLLEEYGGELPGGELVDERKLRARGDLYVKYAGKEAMNVVPGEATLTGSFERPLSTEDRQKLTEALKGILEAHEESQREGREIRREHTFLDPVPDLPEDELHEWKRGEDPQYRPVLESEVDDEGNIVIRVHGQGGHSSDRYHTSNISGLSARIVKELPGVLQKQQEGQENPNALSGRLAPICVASVADAKKQRRVSLDGTLRTLWKERPEKMEDYFKTAIAQAKKDYEQRHGVDLSMKAELHPYLDPVVNDRPMVELSREGTEQSGEAYVEMVPKMGGDSPGQMQKAAQEVEWMTGRAPLLVGYDFHSVGGEHNIHQPGFRGKFVDAVKIAAKHVSAVRAGWRHSKLAGHLNRHVSQASASPRTPTEWMGSHLPPGSDYSNGVPPGQSTPPPGAEGPPRR